MGKIKSEKEKLQTELDDLELKVDQLTEENERLKKALEQQILGDNSDKLSSATPRGELAIEILKKKLKEAEEELAKWRKKVAEAEEANRQLEEIKKKYEKQNQQQKSKAGLCCIS